jgi:hypothetical protein
MNHSKINWALLLMIIGGYLIWLRIYPPLPHTRHQQLFEGIRYLREVRRIPRPLVINLLLVDLTNQQLSFLVTPGEQVAQGELRARTTSQFLTEFKLQVAINGSFFFPFHSNAPWSYYPHVGDPVKVLGLSSSRGQVYSPANKYFATFYLSADNRASFEQPLGEIYNALSGKELLLKQGQPPESLTKGEYNTTPYPRSAIALDQEATTLILMVVDGKQTGYSEGVTLHELAEIIKEYQGYTALNLDGGGSATLVTEGPLGKPVLLNSPFHTRIRGRERPVANHLGIYVSQGRRN